MRDKVREILDKHELLRLATKTESGLPNVRSVDYVYNKDNEGILYFTTFKHTRKVAEIAADNQVYIVVDQPVYTSQELSQLKYIRGTANAFLVDDIDEVQSAMALLNTKYPYLKDLPGDPSMMSIYRLELDEIEIIDNSVNVGHVDQLKY